MSKTESSHFAAAKRPTDDELKAIVTETRMGLPEPVGQTDPNARAAEDEIDAEMKATFAPQTKARRGRGRGQKE